MPDDLRNRELIADVVESRESCTGLLHACPNSELTRLVDIERRSRERFLWLSTLAVTLIHPDVLRAAEERWWEAATDLGTF
jgi:hypothetical protein